MVNDRNDEIENYDFNFIPHRGTIISAHISDLHFPVMDPKKQYDILESQFLSKIFFLPKLDLVCVNGDLYDHKVMVSSDATYYATLFVSRLVEICKAKNATLIILQGTLSHDANQIKVYLHYMNRADVDVRIVTNIQFEMVKNSKILCIPELNNLPENVYQQFLSYSGFYDMAIMHGNFHGAVYEKSPSNSRIFTIEDFNNCRGPIVSGHIHKPGCFGNHFYYCGSPYRWRFDDDHEKGFILLGYDLDSRLYYLDYEEIFSDIYKTFTLDHLIDNDPKKTIDYIQNLKQTHGIDFIKIRFSNDISMADKMILNNKYNNEESVTLEYKSIEREIQEKSEQQARENVEKFGFLLNNKLSDLEKFVMWVNYSAKNEKYITVDELTEILGKDWQK